MCICQGDSLSYAYNAVLIAETEDNLQKLLYASNKKTRKWNMKISKLKTKSMTIAKDPRICKLVIDNVPIEQVMDFD